VLFYSKIIQSKIPQYERWALNQRTWVDERVKTRDIEAVSTLEASSKAAFYSIHRRMDSIEDKMATDSQRLSEVEVTQQTILEQQQTILGLVQELVGRGGPAATAATAGAGRGKFCFSFFCRFVICFLIFLVLIVKWLPLLLLLHRCRRGV
jgi:hypothetical protein